jgi:multidrug efflux pump
MNISEPFVRRPIATSLLAIGLMLAGAVAYRFLPVAPLPQVDQRQCQLLGGRSGNRRHLTRGTAGTEIRQYRGSK